MAGRDAVMAVGPPEEAAVPPFILPESELRGLTVTRAAYYISCGRADDYDWWRCDFSNTIF